MTNMQKMASSQVLKIIVCGVNTENETIFLCGSYGNWKSIFFFKYV